MVLMIGFVYGSVFGRRFVEVDVNVCVCLLGFVVFVVVIGVVV